MKILVPIIFLITAIAAVPMHVHAQETEAVEAARLWANVIAPDERINRLRVYLAAHNSPLVDESDYLVSEADRLGLDWKLVAAIAGTESTFGKHIPSGSYNAWGWGIPTGTPSGIAFGSWKQGITTVSEGLKTRYIDRGALSLEQIGRIYAASPRWAGNVRFFMNRIEAFTPADPNLLEVTL